MLSHRALREPTTSLVRGATAGVELAVHDFGGGTRPMLFLHGTGMVSRMWEPVIARLTLEDVRPLCVDLRLQGASRYPPGAGYTDEEVVADLVAVMDRLDLIDAWAVGHSMGGATLIQTSAVRPERLSRLWVYEPIIYRRATDHETRIGELGAGVRKRRAVYPTRAAAGDRYRSRPPLDELHPEALDAYLAHGFADRPDGSVELVCTPENEARAFEQFLQDGWSVLSAVQTPTLVAHGEPDGPGPAAWSAEIAAELGDGRAECFTGAQHFGPFGQLAEAARSIDRWFAAP